MNTAEKKIKTALNLAVDFKNNGSDPTEAVSKAASLEALNPDMTERLVEAFNIALTNATIKNASDKTASFPLADRDLVMRNVFDVYEAPAKTEKKASDDVTSHVQIEAGDIDLSWMLDGRQKLANLDNPEEMVRHVYGTFQNAQHELSKVAQDVFAASQNMENGFFDVCSIATTSEFLGKFATFEMQALSEYGEQVRPVLDNIFDAAGLDRFGEKRFEGSVKIAADFFPETEIYSAFDRLMNATNAYHEANGIYSQKGAEVQSQIEETNTLLREAVHESSAPEVRAKQAADLLDPISPNVPLTLWDKLGADREDDGGGGGGGGIKGIDPTAITGSSPFDRGSGLLPASWKGVSSSVSDQYSQAHGEAMKNYFRGPKDEVDLEKDNIKRITILRQLMADDEIISKVDPKQIEQSYSALLQTAPQMTLNPAVVQGWLRQSSATQAVDPFSAKQLLDLEKGSLQNKALAKGEKMPML